MTHVPRWHENCANTSRYRVPIEGVCCGLGRSTPRKDSLHLVWDGQWRRYYNIVLSMSKALCANEIQTKRRSEDKPMQKAIWHYISSNLSHWSGDVWGCTSRGNLLMSFAPTVLECYLVTNLDIPVLSRDDRWWTWEYEFGSGLSDDQPAVPTHMSISILTIIDDGSSLGEDRIPITTSCWPSASTPALNWATFVLSRQLSIETIEEYRKKVHKF